MLPGERLAVDGREKHSNQTEGREILSACDPVNRGNTTPTDIISTQPQPAAAPPAEASRQAAVLQKPQRDLGEPACPRCGLAAPDPRRPPLSPAPSRVQGSRSSVHNGGGGGKRSKRSRSSVAGSHRTAATPADACFHVLLACLSCRWSAMLLGVLEACSSCLLGGPCSSCLLGGPCSSCLRACARCCCSAVQEAPVEELDCHAHCHATLVESCCDCEAGECLEFCLEFCLECCDLCHRS